MVLSVRRAKQRNGFPSVLLRVSPTRKIGSAEYCFSKYILTDMQTDRQTDTRRTDERTHGLTVQPYMERLGNAQSIFVSETVRSLNSMYTYYIYSDVGAGNGLFSNDRDCQSRSKEDNWNTVLVGCAQGSTVEIATEKMHTAVKNNNNVAGLTIFFPLSF